MLLATQSRPKRCDVYRLALSVLIMQQKNCTSLRDSLDYEVRKEATRRNLPVVDISMSSTLISNMAQSPEMQAMVVPS